MPKESEGGTATLEPPAAAINPRDEIEVGVRASWGEGREVEFGDVEATDADGLLVRRPGSGIQERIGWDTPGLRRAMLQPAGPPPPMPPASLAPAPEVLPAEEGPTGPLASEEREQLERCEQVVQRGLDAFLEVGEALKTIHDRKLFRETHRSFRDYLAERWPKISRAGAYRAIAGVETRENLSQLGTDLFTATALPTNAAQLDALSGLTGDQQRQVVRNVGETAEGPITAARLKEEADRVAGRERKPAPAPEPPAGRVETSGDTEATFIAQKTPAPAAEPVPAPTPAAPEKPTPGLGAWVQAIIREADNDWLTSQGLTLTTAIARLRRLHEVAAARDTTPDDLLADLTLAANEEN